MYIIVKMSSGWIGKKLKKRSEIDEHVDNGDIVCLCDDIENFKEEMGVEVKMV